MPPSLAVRPTSTGLARVHQVLETFAARDPYGEMLTAVRHFPSREAQWTDFPAWVHADLGAVYAAKGLQLRRTRANPRNLPAAARAARTAQKLLNRVERLEHRMRSGDRVLSLPLRNPGSTLKRQGEHLTR